MHFESRGVYNQNINTKLTVDELVCKFLEKGGRIDKYYLQGWSKNKPTLVYLKGWFRGKNIREAILKALT